MTKCLIFDADEVQIMEFDDNKPLRFIGAKSVEIEDDGWIHIHFTGKYVVDDWEHGTLVMAG